MPPARPPATDGQSKIWEKADWSRHECAPDPRDPRCSGWPCEGYHRPPAKWSSNQHAAWQNCGRCALRLEQVPFVGSPGSEGGRGHPPFQVMEAIDLLKSQGIKSGTCTMRGTLRQISGRHQAAPKPKAASKPKAKSTPAPRPDPDEDDGGIQPPTQMTSANRAKVAGQAAAESSIRTAVRAHSRRRVGTSSGTEQTIEAMEVDAPTTKRGHGSEETSKVVKEVSEEPSREAVLAWKNLLVGLVVRQPELSVICK